MTRFNLSSFVSPILLTSFDHALGVRRAQQMNKSTPSARSAEGTGRRNGTPAFRALCRLPAEKPPHPRRAEVSVREEMAHERREGVLPAVFHEFRQATDAREISREVREADPVVAGFLLLLVEPGVCPEACRRKHRHIPHQEEKPFQPVPPRLLMWASSCAREASSSGLSSMSSAPVERRSSF